LTFSGFYIAANLIKAGFYIRRISNAFLFFLRLQFVLFLIWVIIDIFLINYKYFVLLDGYNSIFTLFILD